MTSSFAPKIGVIREKRIETTGMRTFKIKLLKESFAFKPGQFVEVTVFGVGEFPCSISSNPFHSSKFNLTVRSVGKATKALFKLKKGARIGIRGPFGNGFPLEKAKGKELLVIGGGIGFAPVKPVVQYFARRPKEVKAVKVFVGAQNPKQLLFKGHLRKWKKAGVKLFDTIDHPCIGWKGEVGYVSCLLNKKNITDKDSIVFMCGPPKMMEFCIKTLKGLGLKEKNIFLSLERLMSCGVGKCLHCRIGSKRVCVDGPVFNATEIKKFPKVD